MSRRRCARAPVRPGVRAGALALALALAGCAACLPAGDDAARPRNVLLVSIDTLRADRLGCYGRADAGTPVLDGLAAGGTRFADAMAPSPITLPSHATLLSGQDTARHGVRENALQSVPADVGTLARWFRDADYRTGGFVASIVLAPRYGLDRGFETYGAPGERPAPGPRYHGQRSAWDVNREALEWLDDQGAEPFFLFVHYVEPHVPYEPPEPERTRFPRDRYQGEVAAADRALGELLADLEERDRLERTLVVVVADHGESLGEHGEQTHGLFLYQATLHVPMIFSGPGVRPGRVVSEPVGLVDVAPTLIEALGLEVDAPMDGRSLWPALGGAAAPGPRELYAETFVPRYGYGWSELRALREGPWKYIRAPRPELYALDADPAELRNRIDTEPERAAHLEDGLQSRLETRERTGDEPTDVALSEEQRRAFAALGYVGSRVETPAAGTLTDPKDHVAELETLETVDRLMGDEAYAEAERLARRTLEANPRYVDIRIRLLRALIRQGRIEPAIEEGRTIDRIVRDLPDGERLAARAHLLLGHMYLDLGRREEAAAEYERALVVPQSPKMYDMIAAIYYGLGRRQDAVRVLQALVDRGDAPPLSLEALRRLREPTAPEAP